MKTQAVGRGILWTVRAVGPSWATGTSPTSSTRSEFALAARGLWPSWRCGRPWWRRK